MLFGLGIAAGVLTTVAGLGGGILLVLLLSLWWGAPAALAATAPALLLGNVHRAYLYRRDLDREVARRFALGAVPGALLGGLVAAKLPSHFLQVAMLLLTGYAIARAVGWVRWRPPARAITPVGVGVGLISATAGGGAILAAPVLMSFGLSGARYLATVAVASVALHAGRIVGYGAAGLFDPTTLERAALLAAAILAGNVLGHRIRALVPERAGQAIEVATLGACTLLAVAGVV